MRKNRMFTFDVKALTPHLPILAFTFVLLISILFGSAVVQKYESLTKFCTEFLGEYCTIRKSGSLFDKFYNSFVLWMPVYIVMFLMGVSVIGCVTSPGILVFMGFCYGCLSGYLYSGFGLVGIVFCALVIVPSALTFLLGLIILAREAFGFAYLLCSVCVKNSKPQNLYSSFRTYCVKCFALLLCPLISVVLDMGISSIFLKYFNL